MNNKNTMTKEFNELRDFILSKGYTCWDTEYQEFDDAEMITQNLQRYTIKEAIAKSQIRKSTARSKKRWQFWSEVEQTLKDMLPQKKGKWEE